MPDITDFTMPSALEIDTETATQRYARFVSEPWEKGFGHTLGNALRRVLLSSLEGVAVCTVRIDGIPHEFSTIPDVVEDVTEIILNIKKLRVTSEGELPRTLELYADKKGPVTAASIQEDGVTDVLNPDLQICTLDRDRPIHMEIQLDQGRGYRPAELNKSDDQPIGVIPVDCLFSPIERVSYDIQACRVGQRTDYDRLEMQIWTDGRVTPQNALLKAARILQDHLNVFLQTEQQESAVEQELSEEEKEQLGRLMTKIEDLELSVRAKNCLHNANIAYVGELVQKNEAEMLKFRNFGKKSLEEIKKKLENLDLDLEMPLSDALKTALQQRIEQQENAEE